MIKVEEITKYVTSDGMEFYGEELAMEHEIELAIEGISSSDLIVKDQFRKIINIRDLWFNVDNAFYVEIKSEAALNFFNAASEDMGTETLPDIGIYRYDSHRDTWVSPFDDIERIRIEWKAFNEKIHFSVKEF